MGVDACPVPEGQGMGDLMTGEPATGAPVNNDRNYNGPKVVKFLVGCELPAPGQKDPMKLHCSLGLALGSSRAA
ncbi:hypothetical protein Tco_0938247 [Tanacetum coccineum]|uniref:Uncharacterized protein n=1 Tax=Tanacetum coccineum TaxID=301880 RepID=A0ABQ5DHA9_9ASTR